MWMAKSVQNVCHITAWTATKVYRVFQNYTYVFLTVTTALENWMCWKTFLSSVHNIIGLIYHEKVCLSGLYCERYLSHHRANEWVLMQKKPRSVYIQNIPDKRNKNQYSNTTKHIKFSDKQTLYLIILIRLFINGSWLRNLNY